MLVISCVQVSGKGCWLTVNVNESDKGCWLSAVPK